MVCNYKLFAYLVVLPKGLRLERVTLLLVVLYGCKHAVIVCHIPSQNFMMAVVALVR